MSAALSSADASSLPRVFRHLTRPCNRPILPRRGKVQFVQDRLLRAPALLIRIRAVEVR